MENQRYDNNHHHHHYHNNTNINSESFINIPLLIMVLIYFFCMFLSILLMFVILYLCKNYKKICNNTPCLRNKRKKGIVIELGNLSHKITYEIENKK